MADVFISYSRVNVDFARRLNQALRANRYDVWIDLEGIRFTADWWEEIKRGIEACTNFVVVMSPQSLASPVCHLEIEYARKLNKRIILLAHETFNKAEVSDAMLHRLSTDAYINTLLGDRNPMMLFDNNWYVIEKYQRVQFTYDASKSEKSRRGEAETEAEHITREDEEQRFLKQFTALRQDALDVDLEHANFHTRMVLRTRDWQTSGQNDSFLLFGDELAQAESWLSAYDADAEVRTRAGTARKLPTPTEEQRTYIHASRTADDKRALRLQELEDSRQRSEQARKNARRTLVGVALISMLVIVAAVMIFTFQVNNAQTQVIDANTTLVAVTSKVAEGEAQIESLNLTMLALGQLQHGYINKAALLGIRALSMAYTPQAAVLALALMRNGHGEMTLTWNKNNSITYSNKEKRSITILDRNTNKQIQTLTNGSIIYGAWFSKDGRFIITTNSDKTAIIWDASSGKLLHTLIGHKDDVASGAFSPDNRFVVTASFDGTAIIWDATSGNQIYVLHYTDTGIRQWVSAAFSPDGHFIITPGDSDNTAHIWDVSSGEQVRVLTGRTDSIFNSSFNVMNYTLSDSYYSLTSFIWDASSGEQVRILKGRTEDMISASSSISGKPKPPYRGMAVRYSYTDIIWEADYQTIITTACKHLVDADDFTEEEREQLGILEENPICQQNATSPPATPASTSSGG